MSNDRQATRWELTLGAVIAAAAVAGCTTTGPAPVKNEGVVPGKKAAAAQAEVVKKPVAAEKTEAAKPAPSKKPKLAIPQLERPEVPPVVIPAPDWQNAQIAPSNRAEVLETIMKKQRPDEFESMIRVTDMDGKQLAVFLAAMNDRIERLRVLENSEKGKRRVELRTKGIPAAQEGTDEAKLRSLVMESNQLDAEYGTTRTALRAMVMGVMTLQQQRVWAAYKVMGAVMHSMRGVRLDPEQQKKALSICQEASSEMVKEDTVAKDPYLGGLFKGHEALLAKTEARVRTEVLTKEQQGQLAPKQ